MTDGVNIPALIAAEAQAQGVDPSGPLGIWRAEGSPDMSAVSPKGAKGVFQLMDGTAKDLGVDPMDLPQNIKGGVSYYKQQLDTFKDPVLAAAAYNAGPGAVMAHGNTVPPYPETQAYVQKAMAPPPPVSDGIFDAQAGAAPQAPAQPQPSDGIFADTPTPDPGQAPPPAAGAPPTVKVVNGQIVFGDTGAPVGANQVGSLRTLMKAGIIDGTGDAGSLTSPFVQRNATDKFSPGQYYIDATSGHLVRTPGAEEVDPGFGHGLWAGVGDIPNSILKLYPGHADSDISAALDAQRQVYDANHQGDVGAMAGRFTGQVLGSLPLMGVTESGLNLAASKAPSLMQPALDFLAGRAGVGASGAGGLALRTGSAVARDAIGGAEAATLTSGASDKPLWEQMAEGAAGGAGMGRILHGAGRLAGFARDFDSGLDPAGALDPDQLAAARYAASKLPTGMTVDQLGAADPRLTAGEALGKRGEQALGTVALRDDAAGEALGNTIGERQMSRGGQLLDAVSDAVGVSPQDAQGSVEKMVERGRADADPAYQEAFTDEPIWSPALEKLATRPSMVDAAKDARRLMGEENVDPNGLGMAFVEDPEQWASYPPPAAEAEAAPVGFAPPRGPARAPSQGPSLLKFIADTGGIADDGGEVSAMGGDQWHVGKPFQAKLTGVNAPDDVAQKAWEAGYFPGAEAAPPTNALYDAMGDELRGRALYARSADPAALDRFNAVNAAEERAYRGGDSADVPHPDDYVGRPQPTTEPAFQMAPKTQAWDYMKRALDDQLKPYFTGKLEWTDQARLVNQTRADLVDEVARLNPKYRQALDTSGDYLSAQQASRDAAKVFDNRVSERDFQQHLSDLTPAQRRYMKVGLAKLSNDMVMGAQGQPNRLLNLFKVRRVQSKLQMLLGARKASALSAEMQTQTRMKAFEDYWGPKANAKTGAVGAESAVQDGASPAAELAAQTIRYAYQPHRAFLAGVSHLVGKGWRAATPTPGLTAQGRTEAGAMLGGAPAELAQVLAKLNLKNGQLPFAQRPVARGLIGAGATASQRAARNAAAISLAQGTP